MFKKIRRALQLQTGIIIAAGVLLGLGNVEQTGDSLQVALPVAGLVCAIHNGDALKYTARYFSTILVVHAVKTGLGETQLNQRPSGSLQGVPSVHTASAGFGASYLVNDCLRKNKLMQGAAIFSGAYVGASRIEAGKHFLFQVLVGALIGWFGDRAFVLYSLAKRTLNGFSAPRLTSRRANA